MILYTIKNGYTSGWKIVTPEVWDMLTESQREIITYNGGWVFVKKIF